MSKTKELMDEKCDGALCQERELFLVSFWEAVSRASEASFSARILNFPGEDRRALEVGFSCGGDAHTHMHTYGNQSKSISELGGKFTPRSPRSLGINT